MTRSPASKMDLSVRRERDRSLMAEETQRIAISFGLTATIAPIPLFPRGTAVNIEAPRGVRLSVDFNGGSTQPNVYVLSWHMAFESTACFAPAFAPSVNRFHKQKATDVVRGFDDLLAILATRFAALQSGAAFLPGQAISKRNPNHAIPPPRLP